MMTEIENKLSKERPALKLLLILWLCKKRPRKERNKKKRKLLVPKRSSEKR
jgi:hypothetical protein